jgi:hypothetical protein
MKRRAWPRLEPLEERALLSMMGMSPPPGMSLPPTNLAPYTTGTNPGLMHPPMMRVLSPGPTSAPRAPEPFIPLKTSSTYFNPPPAPTPTGGGSHHTHTHQPSGVVMKKAHYYELYTGPKLAELNAVRASGKLSSSGNFTFTGTNQGKINKGPVSYVWGIDRNGNLPNGPFQGRPNIKFDALVIVSLDSALNPTARVVDLASGKTMALAAGSVQIHGKTVSVKVSGSLLPSTGLAPAQFRFDYWPAFGGSVASFTPEFTTAQVGVMK